MSVVKRKRKSIGEDNRPSRAFFTTADEHIDRLKTPLFRRDSVHARRCHRTVMTPVRPRARRVQRLGLFCFALKIALRMPFERGVQKLQHTRKRVLAAACEFPVELLRVKIVYI